MNVGFDAKRAFNNVTGLGNYSRSAIQSIANNCNYHLYLFTPNQKNQLFSPNNTNIKIIKPSAWTNKHYWRYIGINQDIKNLKIDIYHGLSNDIVCNKKVKTIVTIHDLLFLKYPHFYNPIDRLIYIQKSKKACLNANKIIAISNQTKEDIIYYFNIPEEKIHVIYQACHQNFIENNHPKHLIDKYNLERPFLLYVGTIEERKNLIFLLQALKEKKEMQLICIGKKTTYYKKVQLFIKKHNLQDNVRFIDILNNKELSLIYQKSRGVVYPSIDEGFGIPILEAMYSKTPIITSNKNIFKEIGGSDSYYFEEQNIESLIEQINNVWIASKERDNRIVKNIKHIKQFTESKHATQIINLYKILHNE